ncbi:MAG: hypothetical protein IT338_04740 [Thermomicrobiales bacterium]|nr:hypothetical protein [Thermomicrobiales bacterium]
MELLYRCPDRFIAGQTLLIDGKRDEMTVMSRIKTDLNRRLAAGGRESARKIRACSDDHPTRGTIIQVADMVAGALRDVGGVTGPYLSGLVGRIRLV